MIALPQNFLGGDLFWWRREEELNTLVSVFWGHYDTRGEPVDFTFLLFDEAGECQKTWTKQVYQNSFLVVDSADEEFANGPASEIQSGVLAVLVSCSAEIYESLKDKYRRLYSLIDWYSDEGEICTLHNDHSIVMKRGKIELTEIVLQENAGSRNFLTIVNGISLQECGSLKVVIRNSEGKTISSVYDQEMKPFSVNRIYLDDLFPMVREFTRGEHYTVEGELLSLNLYFRPYVMTEGERLSGYHGGDRYSWGVLPALMYNFLGRGEVNPMGAFENDDISTVVNILNSHGSLEEDFWVDARLYDESGNIVGGKERWLLAKRNTVSRGSIRDLLEEGQHFTGHIALNFSPDEREAYPVRLQALMEYVTRVNHSRVMVWSDEWNSQKRQLERAGSEYRKYFRVWNCEKLKTYISIYNCGVEPDYDKDAPVFLKLRNTKGDTLEWRGVLGANGSMFSAVDEIFDIPEEFMAGGKVIMVESITSSDLAHMQITRHSCSGVHAAEHFMVLRLDQNGQECCPAGA